MTSKRFVTLLETPIEQTSVVNMLALLVLTSLFWARASSEKLPLEDQPLRCCTLIAEPYVYHSNRRTEDGFDGTAFDYLALLRERIGLTCINMTLFTDPSGVGWNTFVERMHKCTKDGKIMKHPDCNCDIGVGGWFENEGRLGVDFPPPYMYDYLTVLVHIENTSTNMGGAFFLTTFSPTVWICIFVLVILFTFLKLLDRRFAPPDDSFSPLPKSAARFKRAKYYMLKSRIPYRLRRAVQSTFSKMIGQSVKDIEGDSSSTRQWVLNYVILLSGIFLILAYEATMTASLVQEKVHSDFESINDFKTCHLPDDDICMVDGDIVALYWESALANLPCRKDGQNGKARFYGSYDEVVEAVATRKCKYLLVDGGTAWTAVNGKYCGTLVMTGEPFYQGGLSFVIPKGSDMMKPMREATLRLRAQGAMDTMQEYFAKRGICPNLTRPRLTFRKLAIFFALAFAAIVLIFLEMVLDPQTAFKAKELTDRDAKNDKQGDLECPEIEQMESVTYDNIFEETTAESNETTTTSSDSMDDSDQPQKRLEV